MERFFSILFGFLFVFGCIQKPAETISPGNLSRQEPLLSWNDRKNKQVILGFVTKTTKEAGSDFIPEAYRIARQLRQLRNTLERATYLFSVGFCA